MKISIKASSMALTRDEILSMVEPSILSYIKGFNKEPFLKAYIVAYEDDNIMPGFEATYTGPKILKFTKEAVKSVYEKVKSGVRIFAEHWRVSPEEQRDFVGTIVGKGLKEIGGKLNSIVVGFFDSKNEILAKDHDSISMESNLQIEPDGTVTGVDDFEGIALVPQGEKPAFNKANTIGAIKATEMSTLEPKSLDWHTIEAEFKRMKGLPSQVSDPIETIGVLDFNQSGDPILTGVDKKYAAYVASLVKQAIAKTSESKNPEMEKIVSEHAVMKKKLSLYESKPALLDKAKQANLGDGFVKYIETRLDRFKPGDNLEQSMIEFIEDKKLDYSDLVKNSGTDVSLPASTGNTSGQITDYNDPKQNPLLED